MNEGEKERGTLQWRGKSFGSFFIFLHGGHEEKRNCFLRSSALSLPAAAQLLFLSLASWGLPSRRRLVTRSGGDEGAPERRGADEHALRSSLFLVRNCFARELPLLLAGRRKERRKKKLSTFFCLTRGHGSSLLVLPRRAATPAPPQDRIAAVPRSRNGERLARERSGRRRAKKKGKKTKKTSPDIFADNLLSPLQPL